MEAFERLSEYLDGELSPQDGTHIQEHVRDCQPCIAFLESLKASIRASRELRPRETMQQLPEATMAKLEAHWHASLLHCGGLDCGDLGESPSAPASIP